MKSVPVNVKWVFLMMLTHGVVSGQPVSPGTAATAATNGPGPTIQFDAPAYDFGKVVAGEVVRHDFIFTNTGDAVLEISGVAPSCGCTTAGSWTKSVEPGKTGTIPLQFNTVHFNGPVAKTASVMCNDRSHPQVVLQIRGTVWKPIEVSPPTAVLNLVADSSSNSPVTVRIVSSLPEPITLSDPTSSSRAFAADLKTIQSGKEFQLVIRRVPPLEPGTAQGVIAVKTSSTNAPSIDVNVIAFVQPAWVITPQQITLPPGPLGGPFPLAVSIRYNPTSPILLSEPAVTTKDVPVEIKEVVPGHQFVLTTTFPAGFQIVPGEQVKLTVKTSDAKYPVISVPIMQSLLPNPNEIGMPGRRRGPVPPVQPNSPPVQTP